MKLSYKELQSTTNTYSKQQVYIMSIYSLNNAYFLWEDIDDIINRIGFLYDVKKIKRQIVCESLIVLDKKHFIMSEEATRVFNSYVPRFKSIHKDMYALIEAIEIDRNSKFDSHALEQKYELFKYFRLLNNKFKHFKIGAEIELISLANLNENILEVSLTFKIDKKIEYFTYKEFVVLFFQILEDYNLITFNKVL